MRGMDYYEFKRIFSLALEGEGYILVMNLVEGKTAVAFQIKSKGGAVLYVSDPSQLAVRKMEMRSFGSNESDAVYGYAKACAAAARAKESLAVRDPAP